MSYRGETPAFLVKRFFGETFGFRGRSNLVSWAAAGAIAYVFIYLPEQRKAEQIKASREIAKQRAIEMGIHDIDRVRPIADPQDRGLIKGNGNMLRQQQRAHEQQEQQQQHLSDQAQGEQPQQQAKQ